MRSITTIRSMISLVVMALLTCIVVVVAVLEHCYSTITAAATCHYSSFSMIAGSCVVTAIIDCYIHIYRRANVIVGFSRHIWRRSKVLTEELPCQCLVALWRIMNHTRACGNQHFAAVDDEPDLLDNRYAIVGMYPARSCQCTPGPQAHGATYPFWTSSIMRSILGWMPPVLGSGKFES